MKMPLRSCAALLLILAAAGECRAFLWWRDAIQSRWAPGADAAAWADASELDEPGLVFRSLNDSTDLHLRVEADGRDGRMMLSGAWRQDVTIWFPGPGQKTRTWGIRLAFSRLGPADAGVAEEFRRASEAPPGPDLEPEMVLAQGVTISTAALPPDIEFRADLAGRDRAYELRAPFKRLDSAGGKAIAFDFVVAQVSADIQRQAEAGKSEMERHGRDSAAGPGADDASPAGNGFSKGGSRRMGRGGDGRRGGSRRSESKPEISWPDPLDLHLRVRLAKEPGAKARTAAASMGD